MNARLPRPLRAMFWLLAVLSVVAIVAWRASVWSPPLAADKGGQLADIVNDDPGTTLFPPDERVRAPSFEGTTLDGKPFALSDLIGHVVVINVWGSWCVPCRKEAPALARLAQETAEDGVRFVGINTRDNPAAADAFVRNYDIPYPSVVDSDGQLLLNFEGILPLAVVPSTVVIAAQGNIAARIVGELTYTTLRGILDDELAIKTPDAPSTLPGGEP